MFAKVACGAVRLRHGIKAKLSLYMQLTSEEMRE
jgi:hypothetical protein